MKNTYRKKLNSIVIFAVMCLSVLLSSCKGLELEDKTEQVEEYTKSQAMILIANVRDRYQNVYSEDIWHMTTEGEEPDKVIISNVKAYMEQLKLICMLAEERGIGITSQERDNIRQMTDEYMSGLTEADISYIGCEREDVQKLYTDLFTACKLIENITKDEEELSDSEVKVIRIQQIATEDRKKALAILKRIKIDKTDFLSMAGRYSELDIIDKVMKKGTKEDLIEETAFSLEEGGISNILYQDGYYYIIKCINGYDEEATLSRKSRIEAALNEKTFREIFDPYKEEHKIRFIEKFWDEIDFKQESGSSVENFFEIFNDYNS